MGGWNQFIIICASLLVSVVVTFIPGWTGIAFTTAEQVLVGASMFTAFILLDVLQLVRSVAAAEKREREQWSDETELDDVLGIVRKHYANIVRKRHGDDDLFVAHFQRKVTALEEDIRKAAQLDQLWVGNHHFGSVDKVMNAFLGERKPLHRSVWITQANERLFELHADLEYFRLLAEAADRRRLGGVNSLCVVSSYEDLKAPRIKAFLDYYMTQQRFDCRIVLAAEYEKALTDAQLSPEFIDFGIYGTRQMFLTTYYEPERKGVFMRNRAEVRRYTEFFDTIWNSRTVRKNPSVSKERMTLDELIAIDGHVNCENPA